MAHEKDQKIRVDDPLIDTLARLSKLPNGKINIRLDEKPLA